MGNAFLKLSPTNIDTILGIIIPIKEMLPTVTTTVDVITATITISNSTTAL